MLNTIVTAITTVLVISFIGGIFQYRRKRKEDALIKATMDKIIDLDQKQKKAIDDEFTKHFISIERTLKDIGSYLLAEDMMGGAPLGVSVPMSPTLRVFSLMLRKIGTFEQKVYTVPANTLKEAMDLTTGHLGAGWETIGSSFIDVSVPTNKSEVLKQQPELEEKKNVMAYMSYLQYASDKFATSKAEKEVLSDLIKRIEKKYGSTN